MRFRNYFILGILVNAVTSCTSSLYKPTLVDVRDTNEFNDLQKGRNLYIHNCASCHAIYYPDQFNAKVWKEELIKMQSRAKLSDTETEFILKYVTGNKQKK